MSCLGVKPSRAVLSSSSGKRSSCKPTKPVHNIHLVLAVCMCACDAFCDSEKSKFDPHSKASTFELRSALKQCCAAPSFADHGTPILESGPKLWFSKTRRSETSTKTQRVLQKGRISTPEIHGKTPTDVCPPASLSRDLAHRLPRSTDHMCAFLTESGRRHASSKQLGCMLLVCV